MSSICIIPARGGSQRIPGKNIKSFLGQPIISYSIKAALDCRLFDEVMVSTDDETIARISKSYGASVPFLRSAENADAFATIADVILEVLMRYAEQRQTFDHLCCIFPTAPLISTKRIQEAYEMLNTDDVDSICPVVSFSYPILRALEVSDDQYLRMIWPEYLRTRSQDLKPTYHDSGSFYWAKTKAVIEERTLFCRKGKPLILNEIEVQDIDSETDWKLAEMKYTLLHA